MADMFAEPGQAQITLESIGWPVAEQPPWQDKSPHMYWSGIRRQIGLGRLKGGHRALFGAARQQYRYNEVLLRIADDFADPADPPAPTTEAWMTNRPGEPIAPPGQTAAPPETGSGATGASKPYVVVSGTNAYDAVLRAVRTIDPEAQLQFAVQGQIVIAVDVNVGRSNQTLENHVRSVLGTGVSVETRWLMSPPHIYTHLIGIGPDQREFRLNNVPSTAQVADVASAVLSEYVDSETGTGPAVNAAVDHVRQRQFMRRLDVHTPLGEAEVQDGDSLRVHRPARAGVQESTWREAVLRVRSQVLNHQQRTAGFTIVSMNNPDFPTHYDIAFTGPGFAPPEMTGGDPSLVSDHSVRITLDHEFPMSPPDVRWRSPTAPGWVCLGPLADAYRPDLDFGEVCRMLADVAGYRNYELRTQAEGGQGYVNPAAVSWAKSADGQDRIVEMGGTRWRFMDVTVSPMPTTLVISPIDEFPDDDE
jgi:hypothetical protein